MIYNALQAVVSQLNDFLKVNFQQTEDKAILGTILDEEGSVPEGNRNKVIMTVVNMDQETAAQWARTFVREERGGKKYELNNPLNYNVDILVSTLFTDYDESLKFLSEAIYFFQAKSVFTKEDTPKLPDNIQQLSFETIKLTYGEAHSLWTALGAKYMPSVLFKMRMLSFQNSERQEVYEVLYPVVVATPDHNVN